MTQEKQRIPRPKGTTELSQFVHLNLHDNEIYNKLLLQLQQHIVRHYINNNYHYCHIPLSTIHFSNYTNIEEDLVHKGLIERSKDMGQMLNQDRIEESHREMLGIILSGALRDRQSAEMHQSILLQSQGTGYKAFISSEVTKALKLSQDSNAQLLSVIKSIIPNKGPNVLNQFNQQNNFPGASATGTNATVTTDQVLQIIQKQDGYVPLLEDESQKQALALQYNIDSMPEVRAIKQEGMDTRREGLDFGKIADLSDALLLDDVHDADSLHEDRRALELEIDLDSDEV